MHPCKILLCIFNHQHVSVILATIISLSQIMLMKYIVRCLCAKVKAD